GFFKKLIEDHGSIELEWLKDLEPEEAKNYLLSFEGMGIKSVECVRLLAMHQCAFPVDTNVTRIAVRLGWIPLQRFSESFPLHLLNKYPDPKYIQKFLWERLSNLDHKTLYELHYHMITFGKVLCTKNKPNCNACPMRKECKYFASAFPSEIEPECPQVPDIEDFFEDTVLRTEYQVYKLPDEHPLLEKLDKRDPSDSYSYLLAIWTRGDETARCVQPAVRKCISQKTGQLCDEETCFLCNNIREVRPHTLKGTILIPRKTALKGTFPLNGTHFQVNEVFADHASSVNPIDVPRKCLLGVPTSIVYFGTSISSISKGLSREAIQKCFLEEHVCVKGFDRKTRKPKPLKETMTPAKELMAQEKAEKRLQMAEETAKMAITEMEMTEQEVQRRVEAEIKASRELGSNDKKLVSDALGESHIVDYLIGEPVNMHTTDDNQIQ
ncbi:hypothetical protein AALP_AAs71059U000100, partial [Arabis alpina]